MLLKSQSNGSAIPKMADAASSADCTGVIGREITNQSAKAICLLQCAMTFLTAPPAPAVLRAFDQLGIPPGLIADVLGVDRGVVTAWRRGQSEVPEEYRVMLLTYLSVLLPWLYGAESHLTGQASPLPFWRQRTQAARHLLDLETRAAPLLAGRAQVLAQRIDAVDRQGAVRAVAEFREQPKQTLTRRSPRKAAQRSEVSRKGSRRGVRAVGRLTSADEKPAARKPHLPDS